MPSFLVNYRGPGCELTGMKSQFDSTLQKCIDKYGGTPEATGFTVKGINVTYYEIGVHRMVMLELPDSVTKDLKSHDKSVRLKAQQTQRLYTKARIKAGDFHTTGYKLLGNNCVSAVSNVLNVLDPSILNNEKMIVPLSLDAKINAYVESQVKLQSMLQEVLGPPPETGSDEEIIPVKKLFTGGVPRGIWDDVMSSPPKSSSKPVPTVDSSLDDQTPDSTPDDVPTKITFKH